MGGRAPAYRSRMEKAASWDDQSKTKYVYPWGNDQPTADLLNYNGNVNNTTPVGKYPAGKSPYGLYDMAGNVWEWVNDWYNETYYQNSPPSNPSGSASGQSRVLRGGSWYLNDNNVRSSFRFRFFPASSFNLIGFRCSRSP